MLTKLFRYECKATARVLLPVYAGAALLGLLALCLLLLQRGLPVLGQALWFQILCDILLFLCALGLVALMLICLFVNVQRFYRLLGTQGYLMFTVPATTGQHIAARLFCSVGWTALTLAVISALGWLLSLSGLGGAADPGVGPANGWAFYLGLLYMVLLAALGLTFGYLLLYLCMAIGAQWPQKRLFASIVSYFVIQFVLQAVFLAAVFCFALWFAAQIESGRIAVEIINHAAFLAHPPYALLLIPPAVLFAGNALVWCLTHWLLDKKLNLA